jgi:hypothetical protein
MKKYLLIGLAALGLVAFSPQPAKAGVSFGFSYTPAYYYPDYYPGYYYYNGYPYYYGPRYHYWYYHPWRHRYHRWHHWHHRHYWD